MIKKALSLFFLVTVLCASTVIYGGHSHFRSGEVVILEELLDVEDLASHYIKDIGKNGCRVVLRDGSAWNVQGYDKAIVSEWMKEDEIQIYASSKLFVGKYQYKLYNTLTGEEVRVQLVEGPYVGGRRTHYIADIDYYDDIVELDDGTEWEIRDVSSWDIGQVVIIGSHEPWFFNQDPFILINVDLDENQSAEFIW